MLTKTLVNKLIPRIGYRRIPIGNTLALGAMIASFYFIDNQVPTAYCWCGWRSLAPSTPAIFRHEHAHAARSQRRARQQRQRSAVGGDAALHEPGVAIAASLLGLFSAGPGPRESGPLAGGFHLTYLCIGLMSMLAALISPSWRGKALIPGSGAGR